MKITDVQAYVLSVAEDSDDPYMVDLGPRSGCLIRITTDDGLTGLGETYAGFYSARGHRESRRALPAPSSFIRIDHQPRGTHRFRKTAHSPRAPPSIRELSNLVFDTVATVCYIMNVCRLSLPAGRSGASRAKTANFGHREYREYK